MQRAGVECARERASRRKGLQRSGPVFKVRGKRRGAADTAAEGVAEEGGGQSTGAATARG